MDTIAVKLLKYNFTFRKLSWREEFSLKFDGRDARRVLLAKALHEVSGFPVESPTDAYRLIEALPTPILNRVFVIYKGGLPTPRDFTTLNLYQAPNPRSYSEQVAKEESERTAKVELQLDEVEKTILKNSRSVVPATEIKNGV
jgi:hypothetical protein